MNVERFLAYHSIKENPFGAEEARHDPIYSRLINSSTSHPDFAKILGQIDQPSAALVFGEKGSGKTAIRMLIGQLVAQHNEQYPNHQTLLVAYDDLNPVLDRVMGRRRGNRGFHLTAKTSLDKLLETFRLEDHQDAILSLAVTQFIDGLLGCNSSQERSALAPMPKAVLKKVKKLPRELRTDIAVLATLYDQPGSGTVVQRWRRLRSKLRLSTLSTVKIVQFLGALATLGVAGLLLARWVLSPEPSWLLPAAGLLAAAAVASWGGWLWQHLKLWSLSRKIHQEVLAVHRKASDLRAMLLELSTQDIDNKPWPVPGKIPGRRGVPGNQDSRYQLTTRLTNVLKAVGYAGIMVLVDRIDEPTLISGHAQRMRSIVWPMLDNKFLQQEAVGIKLLLPLELRHLLRQESPEFFQEARLDKQNLVDRLTWSGATLYDLCTARLRACRTESPDQIHLTDLFDADVTRQTLIEALDQMHQPRDAFKFLYSTIQEHCKTTLEDQASHTIPRLTLESVRRQQSQRVQELYRGLSPA